MDIFEQVDILLQDIEKRNYENRYKHMLDEAYILGELSKRYTHCIQTNQWNLAYEFLKQITRVVVIMNTE